MSLTQILSTFKEEKDIVKDDDGRYIEKDRYGISLKGVLQRGRLKLARERSPYQQGVGFRPSSFTYNFCKRIKIAQLAGLVTLYDDKPAPRLQFTFDVGHAIHDIVQGYFWDIGILRGDYECLKCDKLYKDILAPNCCPSGTKSHTRKHLRYKEVQAANESYLIRGRCDGILDIENDQHVMDIKSIANRTTKTPIQQFCFEDLADQGPKHAHIVQLTLYMWMLQITRGHLLYVAKNDHQIKTFAIPYDENIIKPYLSEIEEIIAKAQALKEGQKIVLPAPCGKESCPCETILSKMPA